MSARKFAYTSLAQVVGKFLGFFISSFSIVILTSKLGTQGLGNYTTITAFLAFFVNLADFGVTTVMIREIAQNQERREALTADFLGLRILLGTAVLALAPISAYFIPQYHGEIAHGIIIMALAQLLLLINQAFVSVLQSVVKLDQAVFAEIVNRLVTLLLMFWGAKHFFTVNTFLNYVLWITVVGSLVNITIAYFLARKNWKIGANFNFTRSKQLIILVLPMGIISFLSIIHFRSDTILLSLLKSQHDVGVYGYAYKVGEILLSIPTMLVGVIFPQLSLLYKKDLAEFRVFAQKAFSLMLVFTVPFISGIFVMAPYLTTLLSRQSFPDGLSAAYALKVLCIAMFCWYFGSLFQNILLVGNNYKGLMRNITIAVVLNLALNLIFIPLFSYRGAAWTTVTSEIVMLILTMHYVGKSTGFWATLDGFFPVVASSLALCGAVYLIQTHITSPLAVYAQEGRLHQLGDLSLMALTGSVAFVAIMLLWGKRSPLFSFAQLLLKSS